MIDMDRDRLFYYIGTGLLVIALIESTIVPYIIMVNFPTLFIPIETHKKVIGTIYIIAFLFYLLSDKTYHKQIASIFIIFLSFVFLQIIFQQVGNFSF